MASTIVVGDGPGGLSAALFLAKNDHPVTVFGTDETAMHYAELHNYLGIPLISGSEFQQIARRQVEAVGASLRAERVAGVEAVEGRFRVTTEGGASEEGDYLILTEGKNPALALALGLATDEAGALNVDRDGRSSMERVYVIGRSARPRRSQAIISAGAGAAAALDILSRGAGRDVQDWDTPAKD